MEYLDALGLESAELNALLADALKKSGEVTIENPHSMHNIGAGLEQKRQHHHQGQHRVLHRRLHGRPPASPWTATPAGMPATT